MKSINQFINESILTKEDFVLNYINDMTENGDLIRFNDGSLEFVRNDNNGKPLVIAEFTEDNRFREYYKKSKKSKKRK